MRQRIYFEEGGNNTYIVAANKQKEFISMNLSHKEEAFAAQLIRWDLDVLCLSQIILTPASHTGYSHKKWREFGHV